MDVIKLGNGIYSRHMQDGILITCYEMRNLIQTVKRDETLGRELYETMCHHKDIENVDNQVFKIESFDEVVEHVRELTNRKIDRKNICKMIRNNDLQY